MSCSKGFLHTDIVHFNRKELLCFNIMKLDPGFFKNIYSFIWLHQVLVAACGI